MNDNSVTAVADEGNSMQASAPAHLSSATGFTKIHGASALPDNFFWTAHGISAVVLIIAVWCIVSGRKLA